MRNGKIVSENGEIISYFKHDNCHREDGPAFERKGGIKQWAIYGRLHREDGPAVVYPDGAEEWWLEGTELTEQNFIKWKLLNFLK